MAEMSNRSGQQHKAAWRRLILPLCILAGLVVLANLGSWQLKRLTWKNKMTARVEQNLNQPPSTIAHIEALMKGGQDIEYRPVTLHGVFHHDKEQHYFATYKRQQGWFIYTPLGLEDDTILFVNRGFVPAEYRSVARRKGGQVDGVVKITGLARSAPERKPNMFVPDNDLAKNIYYWKSISQMKDRAGFEETRPIAPLFVDADNTANPGGLPVGGVTRIQFVNNHLQYAVTWFGLAGALLVVGTLFMFKRRVKADYSTTA